MTTIISTFPYYGGRFYQLKEIMGILEKHKDQFDVVVDVFGGSGKVLINIPEEWRKVRYTMKSTRTFTRRSRFSRMKGDIDC
ncbi:MAG: hypothetical protein M1526_02435 [Candidatus Thermoplasmatota archaeon]|nr:hypothetical protein [Candidatus Thermoplasmatota archaeon]